VFLSAGVLRKEINRSIAGMLLGASLVTSSLVGCAEHRAPSTASAQADDAPSPGLTAVINSSAPTSDLFSAQFCAGALVAPSLVLTAAHCVAGRSASSIDVVVGADNLCKTSVVGGERRHITEIIQYEEPMSDGTPDVALLLLGQASTLPLAVLSVGLREPATTYVAGWGRTSVGGVAPCRSRIVTLRLLAESTCIAAVNAAHQKIQERWEFCAVPQNSKGFDTCTGDSGGPMYGENAHTSVAMLMGIVSWGTGCGNGATGVYVSVTALMGWIQSYNPPIRTTRAAPRPGSSLSGRESTHHE
jgi:secreted trypsin-like serine protease